MPDPSAPGTASEPQAPTAVVVGAGIAGLVAAYRLSRNGIRALVLDADGRAGGPVRSHRLADVELDAGAESFATARPAVPALLAELGLADRIAGPAPGRAFVQHPDGAWPLPDRALLGIPADLSAPDVRAVLGADAADAAAAEDSVGFGPQLSRGGTADLPTALGPLVRQRMGEAVLRRLVRPVVAGVYATDPEDLDVNTVAPGLFAELAGTGSLAGAVARLRPEGAPGSAVAGLDGGMWTLTRRLTELITASGGSIRTGVRVTGLRRRDDGYLVQLTDTSGASFEALSSAAVVLAGQHRQMRPLLRASAAGVTFPPDRGEGSAVALVTLVLDAPALDSAPRGPGVLVAPEVRGVGAKALTHASAKWPWLARLLPAGRHVLRLSYGRDSGEVQRLTDAELLAAALPDAETLLGVPLSARQLVDADVVRWAGALPAPTVGHREAVQRFRSALAAADPTVALVGAGWAGTGLAAVVGDTEAQIAALLRRWDNRGVTGTFGT